MAAFSLLSHSSDLLSPDKSKEGGIRLNVGTLGWSPGRIQLSVGCSLIFCLGEMNIVPFQNPYTLYFATLCLFSSAFVVSKVPTPQPSSVPSPQPTSLPTPQPTAVPTAQPTAVPTLQPTSVSGHPTQLSNMARRPPNRGHISSSSPCF